jgi:hypothetical protein
MVGNVRGTTRWQHARVEKRIINRDEGGNGTTTSSGTHYVMCAWLDCSNDGLSLYNIRVKTHADGYENTNQGLDQRYMNYAFCSERCKQHWLDDYYRNRV